MENLKPPTVVNYSRQKHPTVFHWIKHEGHRHTANLAAAGGAEQVGYFFAMYFGLAFLFALLLWADPRGLLAYGDPRDENGFADCFFLSVQAMSTIGFGAISPKSTYSNM